MNQIRCEGARHRPASGVGQPQCSAHKVSGPALFKPDQGDLNPPRMATNGDRGVAAGSKQEPLNIGRGRYSFFIEFYIFTIGQQID